MAHKEREVSQSDPRPTQNFANNIVSLWYSINGFFIKPTCISWLISQPNNTHSCEHQQWLEFAKQDHFLFFSNGIRIWLKQWLVHVYHLSLVKGHSVMETWLILNAVALVSGLWWGWGSASCSLGQWSLVGLGQCMLPPWRRDNGTVHLHYGQVSIELTWTGLWQNWYDMKASE